MDTQLCYLIWGALFGYIIATDTYIENNMALHMWFNLLIEYTNRLYINWVEEDWLAWLAIPYKSSFCEFTHSTSVFVLT